MIQRAQLKILTAPEWRGQYRDIVGKGATPNEAAQELAGGFALRKDFTGNFLRKGPVQGDTVEKVYPFIYSNETVDRDWDSIRLSGWQLQNYRKNAVVLWAHDSYSLPIGRTKRISKADGQLVGDILFCPDDINPMGGLVSRMLDGGWLNAGSVGFLPMELEPAQEEERQRRYGLNFLKQELLEFSIVPVPSNPTALQLAITDLGTKDALLWLAKAHEAGVNTDPWRVWAEKVLHRSLKGLTRTDLEEACEELGKSGRLMVSIVRSSEGDLMLQTSAGIEEAEVEGEVDPVVPPVEAAAVPETPKAETAPGVPEPAAPVVDPAAPSPAIDELRVNIVVSTEDAERMIRESADRIRAEVRSAVLARASDAGEPTLTFTRESDGSYLALVNGDVKLRCEHPDDVELGDDGIVSLASAPEAKKPAQVPPPEPARKSVPLAPAVTQAELMAAARRAVDQAIRERRPAGA